MLEYFRKEVFRLKSANYLLRTDYTALKEEHTKLQMHTQSVEASNSSLKHNMSKLSNTNRHLVYKIGEQKELIGKLNQDLKMDNIRHHAELKRRREEILGRNKMHDAELNRLKRENERLMEIISKGPEGPKGPPKYERASFSESGRSLLSKKGSKLDLQAGAPAVSLNIQSTDHDESNSESEDEFGHDPDRGRDSSLGFNAWQPIRRKFPYQSRRNFYHDQHDVGKLGSFRYRRFGGRFSGRGGRHHEPPRSAAPLASVPGSSLGSASKRGGGTGPFAGSTTTFGQPTSIRQISPAPQPQRSLKVNTTSSLGASSLKAGSSLSNAAKLGSSGGASPTSGAAPPPNTSSLGAASGTSSLGAAAKPAPSKSSLGAAVRKGGSSLSKAAYKK
mmetsp:Transcript_28624/g.66575  ORF Transcript_28624/g.66575 Transcript_28624/m.66575 type:complete len:389 (+) Transcript_28624:71-1237(+)